jgi:tripartite-type tricarboxylate transporter receptor subunit TctC
MKRYSSFSVAALLLLVSFHGLLAADQAYPTRPVRVITAEVGGGSDVAARIFAQALTPRLGQQAVVDNRGTLAAVLVARAQPDGYTLLFWGTNVWLTPLMRPSEWDPVRDLAPITQAVSSPNVLVLHPSVAVSTVSDLLALMKARPGQLNCATATAGATSQLAAELFRSMTGANFARIPYKGNGPAINGLLVGETQLMFGTAGSVSGHIKSGRLKAIAVTTTRASALFPNLPTVAATVPGYESTGSWGLFAPIKTPPALIRKLNQESVEALRQNDVREKFAGMGVETVGGTPEQFSSMIKSEIARMGKVIKDAGIRDE